ncbi:MAG: DUF4166 domain-containing protein [Hyphomicrobiales bacterium]|nr:DUF4166 domain-containing protein [Hyphomicrobiales bacterium]
MKAPDGGHPGASGLTILVLGGYGTFGGRIITLLEDDPGLTLIVAGRSLEKAQRFCKARSAAKAKLNPAAFDRDGDVETKLASLRPHILVDASGPFQAYGAQPYRLVEACIAQRVNYLDLADGSEFVAGIHAFEREAITAGCFVLSGVSSFPVLTAAVTRNLSLDMVRVDGIQGGIAPSPYAGIGENVMRAIAGYAGQAITLKRDGKLATARPLLENMRFTIAPPGRLPLRNTLFSLVDVPDLLALAQSWPQAKTVWMGAGPVPEILHRALIAFAWLVRVGILRSLSPLAPVMHFVSRRLRWGEHRGGMFVEVLGENAVGVTIRRTWHLLAEGDDGPLIPSMAVQAIVRAIRRGKAPAPGARAAIREVALSEYEELFAARQITTGMREEISEDDTLYRRILGKAWTELPSEIHDIHNVADISWARGRARVERGRSVLARLAAWFVGFPESAKDIEITVKFEAQDGVERWTRRFGEKSFSSRQFAGSGRSSNLLCEDFGLLSFAMALVVDEGRLRLIPRRWSALGIPLPQWLCPRAIAYETVDNGRFHFHVEIGHALTGLIVRYRGWLVPMHNSAKATVI